MQKYKLFGDISSLSHPVEEAKLRCSVICDDKEIVAAAK
jgi:hypothetical protein